MTTLEIIIVTILSIVAIALVLSMINSEILYRMTIKKNSWGCKIIRQNMEKSFEKFKIDLSWWDKVKIEKVKIKSYDNLKLSARFVDNKSKKIAIVVHGYGANNLEMQQYVKMFYDFGLSVLAVDDRAHGESEGKVITMGYKDRYDIKSWVEYLCTKYPDCEIILMGLSMGAATVCLYSGMEKPENVKAIISDCAYSSAYDVFENVAQRTIIGHLLALLTPFNIYSRIRGGYKIRDVDVAKEIEKCDRPLLLIHGDKDTFVPFYMRDVLYEHAPVKFRHKWTGEGAVHAESMPKHENEYKTRVNKFLNEIGFNINK